MRPSHQSLYDTLNLSLSFTYLYSSEVLIKVLGTNQKITIAQTNKQAIITKNINYMCSVISIELEKAYFIHKLLLQGYENG